MTQIYKNYTVIIKMEVWSLVTKEGTFSVIQQHLDSFNLNVMEAIIKIRLFKKQQVLGGI